MIALRFCFVWFVCLLVGLFLFCFLTLEVKQRCFLMFEVWNHQQEVSTSGSPRARCKYRTWIDRFAVLARFLKPATVGVNLWMVSGWANYDNIMKNNITMDHEVDWICLHLFFGGTVMMATLRWNWSPNQVVMIIYTPLKTNMSTENQWLESLFPIEIVPFYRGSVSFQGCSPWKVTESQRHISYHFIFQFRPFWFSEAS